MKVSLDHRRAETILRHAASRARSNHYTPRSPLAKPLEGIVTGTHLTYKYMLVTGLLAKATDARVHPLSLQAGADLNGAYDARSLCHSVIVPLEATLLNNALGGSNEPYLNKPARFTHIDASNPVRQGKDYRALQMLVGTLSAVKTSHDALIALQDTLFFAMRRISADRTRLETAIESLRGGRNEIGAYFRKLIARSEHGETCMLGTAGLFWLMALTRREKWTISVHPANESGSSSNQVSDIDVKMGSELLLTAEVKDKAFIARDVEHAVSRVHRERFHTLYFIEGPRGSLEGCFREALRIEASKKGVQLHMLNLAHLAESVVAFAPVEITLDKFAKVIAMFAKEARVKDETLVHLREISKSPNS